MLALETLWGLLRVELNQLLKLLELSGHDLKQLLKVDELLLLKPLHLLELLGHDLQQLQNLRQHRLHGTDSVGAEQRTLERRRVRLCRKRCDARSLAEMWSEAPGCWLWGIGADSERGSCQ
jgi:hypothetical protein